MDSVVLHKRTEISGKTPSPEIIDYGEIAINYSKGDESLFIKNNNNEIVKFPQSYSKIETTELIDRKLNEKADMGGVELYSVSHTAANFSTVTISDKASNYKYFDIYAVTDDAHSLFQRVYMPEGKMVSFSASLVGWSNYFTKCKVYKISGTSITTAEYGGNKMAGQWGTHNTGTFERSEAYIGIYRIIGYK